MQSWREFTTQLLKNRGFIVALIIISLSGAGFGFYYYYEQLLASPLWQWVFIPDSPVATILYALSLVLILLGHPSNKLNSISFILMVKVGIWTSAVLLVNFDYYFIPGTAVFRTFILTTHLLMIPMAILLLSGMKKEKPWFMSLLLVILLFLDFADYGLGTHPWMPETHLAEIGVLTIFLSLFLIVFLIFWQNYETRYQQSHPQ